MPLGNLANLPLQFGTLGFAVENAIAGTPLKREYEVVSTSVQILPGDPVVLLTSGLIRRATIADTAILGFAAEVSSFDGFMGGQFPFAPVLTANRLAANDNSSNRRILVYVADGQNFFTGKVKGTAAATNRGGTWDLAYACTGIQPTITNGGTSGSTTYTYKVIPRTALGPSAASASGGQTTSGNATLSATNYNIITWTAQTFAVEYEVWKLNSSTYELLTVVPAGTLTVNDTGGTTSTARSIPSTSVNRSGFMVDVNNSDVDVIQLQDFSLRGVETIAQGVLAKFTIPAAASQYLGAARASS